MSDTPRRCHIEQNIPAELAIRAAIHAVEEVGADPRLTEVVIMLGNALRKLADFVDEGAKLPPVGATLDLAQMADMKAP